MSQLDASTESGESSHADIASSKFDNDGIDVSGVPAVVSWGNEDNSNTMQYLSHSTHDHLMLQIHCEASSSTAFFQLRANVALKARRDRTNVYLSVHPERIRTITVAESDEQDAAANKLGTSTYCLQFVLNRSPALVVPQGDLIPKHKNSRVVLDSLQALVKQTNFSVHLPSSTLTKARLMALCESVSSGNLRSLPRFTDTASLYGGKGGRVIQHVPEPAVASNSPPRAPVAHVEAESPPSYDELSLSSPPRPFATQKSGAKRRRVDASDNTSSNKAHQYVSTTIEMVCERMMERIESGFNDLGSRLDRMERRLTDLETCVEGHAEKLGVSIQDVHQRSSEQVDELRDELDTRLDDVRKETEDTITIRVEDEMYVARDQLEDFVKDEITNVEERLETRLEASLSNANVSLDFSWNR